MPSVEALVEARQESRHTSADITRAALVRHFKQQVKHGIDEALSRGPGLRPARISELLGECDAEARTLLFAACMHAMNRDRAQFLADAVEAFLNKVGENYADDYVEQLS